MQNNFDTAQYKRIVICRSTMSSGVSRRGQQGRGAAALPWPHTGYATAKSAYLYMNDKIAQRMKGDY